MAVGVANTTQPVEKGRATAEARLRPVSMPRSAQDFSAKSGRSGPWKALNQPSGEFFNRLHPLCDSPRARHFCRGLRRVWRIKTRIRINVSELAKPSNFCDRDRPDTGVVFRF